MKRRRRSSPSRCGAVVGRGLAGRFAPAVRRRGAGNCLAGARGADSAGGRRSAAAGRCSLNELDAVAVANTPGLAGSLLVGLAAAKALCVAIGKPLVAVNHLQAHIYACKVAGAENLFPCVGLIVSGGHTSLYRCNSAHRFHTAGRHHRRCRRRSVRQSRQPVGVAVPWRSIDPAGRRPTAIRKPIHFRAHFCTTAIGWRSASAD